MRKLLPDSLKVPLLIKVEAPDEPRIEPVCAIVRSQPSLTVKAAPSVGRIVT